MYISQNVANQKFHIHVCNLCTVRPRCGPISDMDVTLVVLDANDELQLWAKLLSKKKIVWRIPVVPTKAAKGVQKGKGKTQTAIMFFFLSDLPRYDRQIQTDMLWVIHYIVTSYYQELFI